MPTLVLTMVTDSNGKSDEQSSLWLGAREIMENRYDSSTEERVWQATIQSLKMIRDWRANFNTKTTYSVWRGYAMIKDDLRAETSTFSA